jgi:hypothetical protein
MTQCEAPRAQRGPSRKGNFFYFVSFDPTYTAGLAVHLPVKKSSFNHLNFEIHLNFGLWHLTLILSLPVYIRQNIIN